MKPHFAHSLALRADLHCHSYCSDGTLSPLALAQRAASQGVQLWALTDHDDVKGIGPARQAAQELDLAFWPGVEISVTFEAKTIHILGLGIDEKNEHLQVGLAGNRQGRDERARAMAQELEVVGISGAYEGALRLAANNPAFLSRTHFARYIVEQGVCRHTHQVFSRYLTPGKPGFVGHTWASLEQAMSWIGRAGGVSVLAHPGRYGLSPEKENALIDDFQHHGGQVIEVLSSSHSPAQSRYYARLAQRRGLWASCGSDFHAPGESRFDLGQAGLIGDLGVAVQAVWEMFEYQSE
jgi:predicted metal-dependent phosphoesterase TrpH